MILIPFLLMDQKLWAVQGELIVLPCFSFNCRQSLQYYIPLFILLDCILCHFPLGLAIACVFLGKNMLFTLFILCYCYCESVNFNALFRKFSHLGLIIL